MNPVIGCCGCRGIMAAQTAKSKLPVAQALQLIRTILNSQLLKTKQTIAEIAHSLGGSLNMISCGLSRGCGQRGYRAEQACAKATVRALQSRNSRRVDSKVWTDVDFYLSIQWNPAHIAGKVAVSHECVYLHVYEKNAFGGDLHNNLRSQKPWRKRQLCGRDRRGQNPNRRPISDSPSHI